jgi:hypothetical protein
MTTFLHFRETTVLKGDLVKTEMFAVPPSKAAYKKFMEESGGRLTYYYYALVETRILHGKFINTVMQRGVRVGPP